MPAKPDWADAHYSRVYVTLGRDYPDVWWADELLAWYVRLLVAANGCWPSPAMVPANVPDDVYRRLVAVGVIDHVPQGQYTIHGLAALREAEERRYRAGGLARADNAQRRNGKFTSAPRQRPSPATRTSDKHQRQGVVTSDAGADAGPATLAPATPPAIDRFIDRDTPPPTEVGGVSLESSEPPGAQDDDSFDAKVRRHAANRGVELPF